LLERGRLSLPNEHLVARQIDHCFCKGLWWSQEPHSKFDFQQMSPAPRCLISQPNICSKEFWSTMNPWKRFGVTWMTNRFPAGPPIEMPTRNLAGSKKKKREQLSCASA